MNDRPCATEPDLWFGYADDDASDGAAKARVYERSAIRARTICLRRCPLAGQRACARQALAAGEEYGVWAGIKLPGGQYRKRHQLAHARDLLRRIADGLVNPRELQESTDLLADSESKAAEALTARPVTVVHRPLGRPVTAA